METQFEDRPLDIDYDAVDAALEAFEARVSPRSPEQERARLRELGAPAHLCVDLSDADALWVPHDCASDDTGACPACTAYVAAGGVL